jgi:hypothetical protein
MTTLPLVALVITLAVPSLSSSQTSPGRSCTPAFEPTQAHRGVPSTFVDQGLASLPHVYPRHELLVQRRYSEVGDVGFSLLVYKPDGAKPDVTVEGMAVHDSRAWRFTARCSSDQLPDALVTTLEEIAKLSKSR